MISKRELENAISECESAPMNYQNCEKLATFYSIYDHLYREIPAMVEKSDEQRVGSFGDSDFLKAIQGKDAEEAWLLMDELMQTVQVTNTALYNGVMRRL